jgi:Flp pilus assembly protein TadG
MRRVRRGQNTVEMALMLPLVLLMIAVFLDFGRIFYMAVTVANSARVAAEFATSLSASTPDWRDVKSEGERAGAPFVSQANITLEYAYRPTILDPISVVSWTDSDRPGIGQPVRVTVTAVFRPIFPFSQALLGAEQQLRSRTWMRRPCDNDGGNANCGPGGPMYYFPLP